MISDYNLKEVPDLLIRQLRSFFPLSEDEITIIAEATPLALDRVEKCIDKVDNKYFHRGEECFFSPFHSGQWLIFLYYLGNLVSMNVKVLQNVKMGGVMAKCLQTNYTISIK